MSRRPAVPVDRLDLVAEASGHDRETVLAIVRAWRLHIKVPGAKTRGSVGGTPGKLKRFDLARMARTEPPEPDFLVDLIAARGEVTNFWGPPGIGKSLFIEAAAGGVALGQPVAGVACKKGRVLYLDAENGEYEVHRRVRSLGLPPKFVSIYDAGANVHIVEDYGEIAAVVQKERPDLLVFDSLRRLTPGSEENDSGVMAEAIGAAKRLAQEFNVAVVLIHHARKDGLNYRGSSAIRDQVSISWQMGRADGDVDRGRRFLRCDKMRIGPEPDERWLHIVHEDGQSVTVVEGDGAGPGGGSSRRRASVADEIVSLLGDEPLSRPTIAKKLGRTTKDGTVRRAVEDLEVQGRIEQIGNRWALVPNDPTPAVENGTPDQVVADATAGTPVKPATARARGRRDKRETIA